MGIGDYVGRVRINHGLRAFFFPLIAMTKLRRGRPMSLLANLDVGGWVGTANLVFTGDGGATFNLKVDNRRVLIGLGERPGVDGTVTMPVDEFFKLLSGKTAFTVSMMTGKVIIDGEGHLAILIGALAALFRAAAAGNLPGLTGKVAPLWAHPVMRLSGTGYRLPARSS